MSFVSACDRQYPRIPDAGYYRKLAHQPAVVSLEPSGGEEEESGASRGIPDSNPTLDPVRSAEARDEWHTVVKAINTLTEDQRLVLVGRLILGYDVATVARMLGKQANAVKALQFRALQRLHRVLGTPRSPEQAYAFHRSRQEEDTL